jgi:hypothetical protein
VLVVDTESIEVVVDSGAEERGAAWALDCLGAEVDEAAGATVLDA